MLTRTSNVLLLVAMSAFASSAFAVEMPKLVEKDGRFAFFVEGRPYLILGGQIGNSSAWPSLLPQVWSALEAMHANTVEAPVYWEQMEPQPGHFDFSNVDALLAGARAHNFHLGLLWFGTWKNGNMHYVPKWIKTDVQHYPRMINAAGEPLDVLSANAPANRDADKKAFAALMRHLREADGEQHTVLLMQVENESGAIGTVRDFSPMAEKLFAGAVPGDLISKLGKSPGTWRQVFGAGADEYFQAYYQALYINDIAQAGKAEFPLPMYINVWVEYPVSQLPERRYSIPGQGYPSGGAVQKMVGFWKKNAPAIDFIGPDIYSDSLAFSREIVRTYRRPDNPLWIPEVALGDSYARVFFEALGAGAIGFSPFGVDRIVPAGPGEEGPKRHAENYALFAPAMRQVAQLLFDGKVKTAVEQVGQAQQEIELGEWQATVSYGFPQHDGAAPPGTKDQAGRVMVAQLGPDEFLVTGFDASVAFHQPGKLPGLRMQILEAEEGRFEEEKWKPLRLWNGDQTDRGLQFRRPTWVRVQLGKF